MFTDFIRTGKVKKAFPDPALAKSLIAMSSQQFDMADSMTIKDENASPLLVNLYEALREICEAICAKNGWKVYSHEAFTDYLKDELREEDIARMFDRLRKLRNGVNYYGRAVSATETKSTKNDVQRLIETLKQRHLKDLM
jgi:hypothetical protein